MFDRLVNLVSLFFFGAAVYLIGRDVERIGFERLLGLVSQISVSSLFLALFFTVLDYLILSGYDLLSLNYINRKLPYSKVLEASGIGFAVSNTAGHAYASGGAVRYLFYTPQGLSRLDVLKLIVFETLMFFLGIGLIFSVAVFLIPLRPAFEASAYLHGLYAVAGGLAVGFVLYYYFLIVPGHKFRLDGVEIVAPTKKQTFLQFLIGFCDNFAVFLVFYVILSSFMSVDFLTVFIAFIIAQSIGIATQVPGGMGVFESLFLLLFPHIPSDRGNVLAALAVFRLLYFIFPFLLAGFYLAIRNGIWQYVRKKTI